MSKSIINSRLRRGYNLDSLNVYEQARENAKYLSFKKKITNHLFFKF